MLSTKDGVTMLLEGKNAIIYGAGGPVGQAVAQRFRDEGATVFATTRADVDALDADAVEQHARGVGRVDVSLNLISRGDVQGIPLVNMSYDDLSRPVYVGLESTFNTATTAARIMCEQGSGVILSLTSGSSKGAMPGMGGTGPADAAVEAFLRYLAAEVGPSGVRVTGIHTAGVAETLTDERIRRTNEGGPTAEQALAGIASMAMLRRTPRLADVTSALAFLASDQAGGVTASTVNVTCGLVAG
jgi:NAD(P)-dependent dehydrogenase (short-subunit alcohol dehydrogenase family)